MRNSQSCMSLLARWGVLSGMSARLLAGIELIAPVR